MTSSRFSLFCALAAAAAGCSKDATFVEPIPPQSALHWVQGVPDTGAIDMRPIDIITNAALMDAPFRGSNMFYQGIDAGTRRIRAFMDGTDPAITSVPILDTVITLAANTGYTLIHTGFARTGASPGRTLLVVPDAPPTPGAGQIAIRIVNAAPSLAGAEPTLADTTLASEAFVRKISTLNSGGAPEITSVAYRQASAYAVVDTGRYWVGLRAAGGGPVYAQVPVPLGTLGSGTTNPIAGSLVPGSVLTMVLLPRSVPSSAAPQGGRPTARATDTTVAEGSRRMFRSGDTVTVQSGSITRRVNRPDSVVVDTIVAGGDTSIVVDTIAQADTVLSSTGTGAAGTLTTRFDVVLVSGATQPEYNGWQVLIAGSGTLGTTGVADTLICNPVDSDTTGGADTPSRCNATNTIATTRFRYRYRIAGTPTSPATGTATYRIYSATTADFAIPGATYLVDRRPSNTIP